MKKASAILLGSILLLGALIGREWFIHSELKSLRAQLVSQVKDQFSSVEDYERLNKLVLAPTVFERYLEPVILAANKLVWPLSREAEINSWRREVHGLIDDQVYQHKLRMKTETEAEVAKINSQEDASIARLMKVLDARGRLLEDPEFKVIVKDEIQKIALAAQEQDRKTLTELRSKGVRIVKGFKERLKKMDHRSLANYLSSGNFHREIESPIVDLILKLRQEETRKNTWAEFQRAMNNILSKKKALIAKNTSKRETEAKISADSKKFQALFDTVAEALRDEESSASNLKVSPRENDFTPDFSNPAAPDYQE